MNSYGLIQYVNGTTHTQLDLVIFRNSNFFIVGIHFVYDPWLSSNKGKYFGYHLAEFIISKDKPDCIRRKDRGLDIKEFMKDFRLSQFMNKCDISLVVQVKYSKIYPKYH